MKRIQSLFLVCLLAQAIAITSFAQAEQTKTFTKIRSLRIALVSGNCEFRRSADASITVSLQFDEASGTTPLMLQEKDKLIIKEDLKDPVAKGRSTWVLNIPDDLPVTFLTTSGKLQASGLKLKFLGTSDAGSSSFRKVTGDIDISLVSGDLDVEDFAGILNARVGSGYARISRSVGDLNVNSDLGSILASDCKAKFRISNKNGNVVGRNISLGGSSKFTTSTGDTQILLSSTPEHDLLISSGAGEALVAFNGNKVQGKIIMRAGIQSGRISAPFGFDKEEETEYDRVPTLQKSTRMGNAKNYLQVNTVSGEAVLKL